MALFGRRDKEIAAERPVRGEEVRPLVGRPIWCRICDATRMFTRCWRRMQPIRQCACCGMVFPDPARLYRQVLPACPQCEEPLEHPGFDYGICDGCGSKYEIMEGTKPGLLPNREQRAEMNKFGKARTERR